MTATGKTLPEPPLAPSIEEPKSPTADLILWRLSQTYMALAMAQHDLIPTKA